MNYYDRVRVGARKAGYPSLQDFIISMDINLDTYYSSKRAGNLPRADEALKVAKALGTTVEYLITGEGHNPALLYRNALKSIHEITGKILQD